MYNLALERLLVFFQVLVGVRIHCLVPVED